ncbi:substrate-binding periplasmic protein [Paremcibacter congregatus]|uniref:Uncharacterized protein n=1 Tax=Paremcibacter congregatus TaxID=2043170 RepID=A0A2G4YW55_9PROT|nr:transporter substrate-binding domain-containing protein [Paremcibacter congregatus]PHZ86493.1 hypothetical protein CRD36_00980 [Paremcibacter congregatus]QDE28412.1 amino acid ABC transporter substrate-binding protein [Paremcibacter congregatus]
MLRRWIILVGFYILGTGAVLATDQKTVVTSPRLELACSIGASMRPQALLYREITDQMARRAGYDVVFSEYPWVRALSEFRAGRLAGIYCLSHIPEREAFSHYFPVPFYSAQISLFKIKSNPLSSDSLEDLLRQSIAVQKDSYNANQLAARGATNLIYVFNDEVECRLLRSGRVTFLISDQVSPCSGKNGGSATGERDVVQVGPPVAIDHLYLGISRAYPGQAKIMLDLQQAFMAMVRDGELVPIYQHHNMALPDEIKAMKK